VKQYYFLSGIPRAGNTILSCILNQNSDIAVTANSLLPEIFYNLERTRETNEAYLNYPDKRSYDSMMENIFCSYYSKWDKKYIIDRSSWGTPYNADILTKYCPNDTKIICLVRDMKEVIKSFIDWSNRNPNNFIDRSTNNGSIEEKFNFLMRDGGQLPMSIASVYNLIVNDPNKENHIVIDYNDLILNTNDQVEKVYNFLEIPKYNHNFKKVSQFSSNGMTYDDSILGRNLHKIRSTGISKRNYDVQLPQSVLDKCQYINDTYLKT
jgi:sulfotransferase